MKILIVEDNEIKLNKLKGCLLGHFPSVDISEVASYSSAVNILMSHSFDLVVLDMSLPSFDKKGLENGGRIRTFGGREIASQMKRRKIPTPFLIVTQYDGFTLGDKYLTIPELDEQLQAKYQDQFLGVIYFDAINNSWRNEITEIITGVIG